MLYFDLKLSVLQQSKASNKEFDINIEDSLKKLEELNIKEIVFVDDLNVVIGKNESGKSNLVEGLSFINLHGLTNKLFFNKEDK